MVDHSQLVLNDVDEESNTPLHLAALNGQTVVVRALLDKGADIYARWVSRSENWACGGVS